MVKLVIKNPPTKISTSEDLEERERNKTGWYPGGQAVPLKDNPSAQAHYRRLIAAGIEDAEDFPMPPEIEVSKDRKKSKSTKPKRKTCSCKKK
jgi:hypothetical protein